MVRNPGFGKEDYEALFKRYLGITHTIWLQEGIAGDDTHGHVDDITRFVGPKKLVTVTESRRSDENYTRLRKNARRLKEAVLEDGTHPELIELPMPSAVLFEGCACPPATPISSF